MDKIELKANTRSIFGKKVKALRRDGFTPANLFGHNINSTALQIDTHELKHTLAHAGRSSLISLKIDSSKKPSMIIIRNIQREPLSGEPLHVDLYQVKMEEKIKIEIPLLLVDEAPAVRDRGGILVQNMNTIEIECLPAHMPHNIEISLSGLADIDQAIHVSDIQTDDNIVILTDPEKAIVQIARRRVEAAEESRTVAEVEEATEAAGNTKEPAAE